MILDVGCGDQPKGDINVDLFPHTSVHRASDLKGIPNFVCANCHYLPFRDNSFNIVLCSHLLEHRGVKLVEASKEMLRVAESKVVVRAPNMFRKSKYSIAHDKIFSRSVFDRLFRNFEKEICYCGYDWSQLYFPIHYLGRLINAKRINKFGIRNPLHILPCPIPTELKIVINKR